MPHIRIVARAFQARARRDPESVASGATLKGSRYTLIKSHYLVAEARARISDETVDIAS